MSKLLKLYHGDNHGTTELKPSLMLGTNCLLGTGIYFSTDISTAYHYGKYVVETTVADKFLVQATKSLDETVTKKSNLNFIRMLGHLMDSDPEAMYLILTNYGMELTAPSEINYTQMSWLYQQLCCEQARNLSIILAEAFGIETFVTLWNQFFPNVKGFYEEQPTGAIWVALVDTNIRVFPVDKK